jgi:hypothetical protein
VIPFVGDPKQETPFVPDSDLWFGSDAISACQDRVHGVTSIIRRAAGMSTCFPVIPGDTEEQKGQLGDSLPVSEAPWFKHLWV